MPSSIVAVSFRATLVTSRSWPDIENVDTSQGDVYKEIGMAMDEFDLMFAFPWPGESGFFEAVFDAGAASGALLMTYRGRDGVNVVRKT